VSEASKAQGAAAVNQSCNNIVWYNKTMRKLVAALLIAGIVSLFGVITPARSQSTIDTPDTYTMNSVEVYRNALEVGDSLYLFVHTEKYAVNPAQGTAADLFLVRLMDGADELGNNIPFPYFDDGFNVSIGSIYFNAAEAPAFDPVGGYTMRVQGNPSFSWTDGTPPVRELSTFSLWFDESTVSATRDRLTVRLRALAFSLQQSWADPNFILVETIPGRNTLTPVGEGYFEVIIDNLRTITPGLFSDVSGFADFQERDYDDTYANVLRSRRAATQFAGLDDLATDFNISAGWMATIVWFLVTGVVAAGLVWAFGEPGKKFMPLAVVVMLTLGALAGFLEPSIMILFSILLILSGVVWLLFYRRSVA